MWNEWRNVCLRDFWWEDSNLYVSKHGVVLNKQWVLSFILSHLSANRRRNASISTSKFKKEFRFFWFVRTNKKDLQCNMMYYDSNKAETYRSIEELLKRFSKRLSKKLSKRLYNRLLIRLSKWFYSSHV